MIRKLTELAIICLGAAPLIFLLRRSWKRQHPRETVMVLFLTFMAGILTLALDGTWQNPFLMLDDALNRIRTGDRINLLPLQTITRQLQRLPASTDQQLTQLLGNTLLFIPWGFCLPMLWQRFRTLPRMTCMCLALPLFIECTQLFIAREVDIDDVLLNFLGGMLGTVLWLAARRIQSCTPKKRS